MYSAAETVPFLGIGRDLRNKELQVACNAITRTTYITTKVAFWEFSRSNSLNLSCRFVFSSKATRSVIDTAQAEITFINVGNDWDINWLPSVFVEFSRISLKNCTVDSFGLSVICTIFKQE